MKTEFNPPFNNDTAQNKVVAETDIWNSKDPMLMSKTHSVDSVWRFNNEMLTGRGAIIEFLSKYWDKKLDFQMVKELWNYNGYRISGWIEYEWRDTETGHWHRTHGIEYLEYDTTGLIKTRHTSTNNEPILEIQRKYKI